MSRALAIDKDGQLCYEKRGQKFGAKPMQLCVGCGQSWEANGTKVHCSSSTEGVFAVLRFASKHEMERYIELVMLEKARAIHDLQLQPAFLLKVNGQKICKYIADFAYTDVQTGKRIYEDAKSKATRTTVYKLKIKLLKAIKGIEVVEV